jgi:glycosyltransferase involved in cell wall biosynthesis
MKIALVCDWLTGMRGGERCLEAICEIYPEADIFTLVHVPGSVSETIESHNIYTSFIQALPGNIKNFRRYLPLFPCAVEKFSFEEYDCVLSFSHCVVKGINVPEGKPHICYCHTPMRYAWHMRSEYLAKYGYIKKRTAKFILDHLQDWDKQRSLNVTKFIANSINVQQRIMDVYNRESEVIYPPVQCDRFTLSTTDDGYYLIVSALVPYKRIDLAVKSFSLTGQKLLIVGNGPDLSYLKSIASGNITFINNASDKEVTDYIKRCTAFILPGEEDFGITPLEAQACGKPVIAFAKGGALETIIGLYYNTDPENGPTGLFFHNQTHQSFNNAILEFEKNKDEFEPLKCRLNALTFDRDLYKDSMKNYVEEIMDREPVYETIAF